MKAFCSENLLFLDRCLRLSTPLRLLTSHVLIIAFCCSAANGFAADAQQKVRIPRLQTIGSLPVQWQNLESADSAVTAFKTRINELFLRSVRSSNKFKVLNDALTEKLWKAESGRNELVQEFELDAFAHLNVVATNDMFQLVFRLLDKNLKPLIAESDAFQRVEFQKADSKGQTDRIENLVYRLFNRLPIDSRISSIQGKYVTLTGGKRQGLMNGSELIIYRVFVGDLHPANQTWLSFEREELGAVKVIDVKETASVAEVVRQNFPGAIEVGDAAMIDSMESRKKFAVAGAAGSAVKIPAAAAASNQNSGQEQTQMVAPLINQGQVNQQQLKQLQQTNQADGLQQKTPAVGSPVSEQGNPTVVQETPAAAEPASPSPAENSAADKDSSLAAYLDNGTMHLGIRSWSVSGFAKASSQLPSHIVNNLAVGGDRSLNGKIKASGRVDYGLGDTGKGSFSVIEGRARVYWQNETTFFAPESSRYQVGFHGCYNGLSVNGEKYGGTDSLCGGIFAAIYHEMEVEDVPDKLDVFLDVALLPIAIGRHGVSGKNYNIKSSSNLEFTAGGFMLDKTSSLEWGASVMIINKADDVGKSSTIKTSSAVFGINARYKLK